MSFSNNFIDIGNGFIINCKKISYLQKNKASDFPYCRDKNFYSYYIVMDNGHELNISEDIYNQFFDLIDDVCED